MSRKVFCVLIVLLMGLSLLSGCNPTQPDVTAANLAVEESVTVSATSSADLASTPSPLPAAEPSPVPSPKSREPYTTTNYFDLMQDGDIRYQLHSPNQPDEDKKYPVYVFLHGWNNQEQTEKYPWRFGWVKNLIDMTNADPEQYEAYVLLTITPGWGPNPQTVMSLIEQVLQEDNADPDRIYITGLSMGGFMASDFLVAYPDIPAAALLICGASNLPPDKARQLVDLPIRLYHSDDDNDVSVDVSRDFYNAILEAGGDQVEYNELTGYGHAIWDYVYDTDMLEWLFSQGKSE